MERELDDIYKRKNFKETVYGDKKSTKDDYTGQKVYRGNNPDAQKKHGTKMTSDTDHVTPIKVVEQRYSTLSKEQQRQLANNEKHNYVTTNSKLNRSKGNLENHEYLLRQLKQGEPENLNTSMNMLRYEINSRVDMRVEATGMYIQNQIDIINQATDKFISEDFSRINQVGIDAATEAAIFAGTLSIVQNTTAVVKGKQTKSEAVKNILVDTSITAATAYATGALAEKFSSNIGIGEAAIIVTGAVQISKLIMSYVDGNIDEKRLATDVAQMGGYLVAGYIGKNVGAFIGGGAGAVLGNIILPGVGGEIGIGLGREIGKIVGEVLTTIICSELISTIQFSKEFKKENNKIISLYQQAEQEIRDSQYRLEKIIQKENSELRLTINEGFLQIYQGIQDNSYNGIENGIATIGSKFGLSEMELLKDSVSKKNIFTETDKILVIE